MRLIWASVVLIASLITVGVTANEAEAQRRWRGGWGGGYYPAYRNYYSPGISFSLGSGSYRPGVSFYYGPSYRSYSTPYYGSYYRPYYGSYYAPYRSSYYPGAYSPYYRWY
jgi:hypothetical protein